MYIFVCVLLLSSVDFSYCIYSCFFFFKQKTAYEMRISDWSSDVCSSDLDCFELQGAGQCPQHWPVGRDREVVCPEVHQALDRRRRLFHGQREIGRASCRERVCQYV